MGLLSSIFNGLGNALSSRSKRKETEKMLKEQRKLWELDYAAERKKLEAERKWTLEDRRYRQESFGNYAQFSPNRYERPELSSTDVTPIDTPQSTNPRERGLLYYT